VFGQDGSYLCELLSSNGYEVYGVERNILSHNSYLIKKYLRSKGVSPKIIRCDLYSYRNVLNMMKKVNPDEVYHLAAKHFSSQSKGAADNTDIKLYQQNVSATLNLLMALRAVNKKAKCVLVGSCLMYDASNIHPQDESTPFNTGSMYGLAKITEFNLCKFYRNVGMHVSMAIFYNHESPRRADNFVTKKIVKNMVMLKRGLIKGFELGNLDTSKDWGYAKDYVQGLVLMAQQRHPEDYILATGVKHTVRDFVDAVSKLLGLKEWKKYIKVDPGIISRNISSQLVGNAKKAEKLLKWKRSVDFNGLVRIMVENELKGRLD
jgi:GDPmannose 4,6-dehydratase